ncbi:hypothetical protein EYF80_028326 [Liparis tanakae]|uniref:Uncharacterized protein n=1 Tax=Liparis tanakae TaxID=230148 RepID=A0A4Z2H6C4_9TELE|nr:hypothetical protein EYF80_028326 [Liparis tanakae]
MEKLLEGEGISPKTDKAKLQWTVAEEEEGLSHQLIVAACDEAVQTYIDRCFKGRWGHVVVLHGHHGLIAHLGEEEGSCPSTQCGLAGAGLVLDIPQARRSVLQAEAGTDGTMKQGEVDEMVQPQVYLVNNNNNNNNNNKALQCQRKPETSIVGWDAGALYLVLLSRADLLWISCLD